VPKRSAGLVVHREVVAGVAGGRAAGGGEVLLVHPGGPFWARRDEGAWSIPKGEYAPDEDPWAVARREFHEELGVEAPEGPAVDLGEITQRGGKRVRAWAVAGDVDVSTITSNTFELEWPRGSGTTRAFPEVDRAEWVALDAARTKLVPAQVELLDRLLATLAGTA
jgi:predicted NUDIX family NTP pyrophosphohydrolase